MQKLYEILEGTIALVALVAIVGISTFSVLALNPNRSTETPKESVAGAFTTAIPTTPDSTYLINNLQVSDENYQTNLVSLGDGNGYEYTAQIKSPVNLTQKKFIEVYNSTSETQHLTFDTEILGQVQDSLKIKVMDEFDTLSLYTPETGVNKVSLTLPPSTRRILDIQYEFLQNVNFGFQVNFKLK